nr:hypothetical protein [Kibdelosporangium sp. MJ126-NF4]
MWGRWRSSVKLLFCLVMERWVSHDQNLKARTFKAATFSA